MEAIAVEVEVTVWDCWEGTAEEKKRFFFVKLFDEYLQNNAYLSFEAVG